MRWEQLSPDVGSSTDTLNLGAENQNPPASRCYDDYSLPATQAGNIFRFVPSIPDNRPRKPGVFRRGICAAQQEEANAINMIDGLFNQTNYVAVKKMLDLTALKHEAIASNLAHVETPRYKRIDVSTSFANELQQAVAAKDLNAIAGVTPRLSVDPTAQPLRKDGNTVQLETELMKLNQNVVEHQIETQLITGNLLKLRLAITGRG